MTYCGPAPGHGGDILGSGDVGRKLADSFIQTRHIVRIGSRNPDQEKITEWMAKHYKAKVSSYSI